MIFNTLDRKLVPALKTLRKAGCNSSVASSKFRELRLRVLDADIGKVLDEVSSQFTIQVKEPVKPKPESAIESLRLLRDRGFIEVESFLFEAWKETLAEMPFERILELAGNAAALEAWRKTTSLSMRGFENRLLADPERTFTTPGSEWLLLHGNPRTIASLLQLLLARRSRPKYLPSWAEVLESALKKDKNGVLLDSMLRVSSENLGYMATLAEVLRLDPTLLKNVLENLPSLLSQKDAPTSGAMLLELIFSKINEVDAETREFLTATLARLGTGIVLSGRRNGATDAVFAVIEKIGHQLRNQTLDETFAARTWLFGNLIARKEKASGHLQITLDGARDVALAFEKLAQGFDPIEVLKMTVVNLGLKPIGSKATLVAYDPLSHQDLDGGMLPGDSGIVVTEGWMHGNEAVLRAKIRKGGSCV